MVALPLLLIPEFTVNPVVRQGVSCHARTPVVKVNVFVPDDQNGARGVEPSLTLRLNVEVAEKVVGPSYSHRCINFNFGSAPVELCQVEGIASDVFDAHV